MRYTAVLDANVLVPNALADLLLRLAERGFYRPLWSNEILAEVLRTVVKVHPDIEPARIENRLRQMGEAFLDACVTGWEPLVPGLQLPDVRDRHVLATAIGGRADAIVTANLKDFPACALDPHEISTIHPDEFLLDQFDLRPAEVTTVIVEQANARRRPPTTPAHDAHRTAGHPRPLRRAAPIRRQTETVRAARDIVTTKGPPGTSRPDAPGVRVQHTNQDSRRIQVPALEEVALDLLEDLRRPVRPEQAAGGHRGEQVGDLDAVQDVGVEHDDVAGHGPHLPVVEPEFLGLLRHRGQRRIGLGVGTVPIGQDVDQSQPAVRADHVERG